MFSLICAWINGWVNNRGAGDLRCHCAHYDVTVMRQNGFKIPIEFLTEPCFFACDSLKYGTSCSFIEFRLWPPELYISVVLLLTNYLNEPMWTISLHMCTVFFSEMRKNTLICPYDCFGLFNADQSLSINMIILVYSIMTKVSFCLSTPSTEVNRDFYVYTANAESAAK